MIAQLEGRSGAKVSIKLEGLPPIHSVEAERSVLGAMLSDPEHVIDRAAERLRAEDFFHPAHQALYTALLEMRNKGQPVDPSTVLQFLEDRKLADSVGGAPVLGELSAGVISVLTAPTHIETVRAKSLLRHLQQACAQIVYSAQERQHEVDAVLDEAESQIFKITETGVSQTVMEPRKVVLSAIDMIQRNVDMKGRYDGLPSGFHDLDQMTTGFKPQEMIVIAARPGVGKTALALTMAKSFVKARYDAEKDRMVEPGYPVGIFSLEMSAQQLMVRLLASYANVSLQSIREGKLSSHELDALSLVAEQVAGLPLYIDESSMLNIGQLRAKARRMKQMHGIEALIIDYLQLLTSSSEKARDNRQVEVAEISRGIKGLARELNIPIIVLAQLNRKPEEGNQDPALHHLRESGSIEQDADIVMLLSRKFEKEEGDSGPGSPFKATLHVAKQRNGPTGKVDLIFHGAYTRYDSAPRDPK
ncbi:MAG: replicative DNA helicase [Candidatus Methylacidiphilales bacterium]|nr:replicative DNA helicase [Candidatus Methylacidiphilales bacterium]